MNIEIARSFSQKVDIGNYQNVDFFASFKAEVSEEEAIKKSGELFEMAKSEVEKSIREYKSNASLEKGLKNMEQWQNHYNKITKAENNLNNA